MIKLLISHLMTKRSKATARRVRRPPAPGLGAFGGLEGGAGGGGRGGHSLGEVGGGHRGDCEATFFWYIFFVFFGLKQRKTLELTELLVEHG